MPATLMMTLAIALCGFLMAYCLGLGLALPFIRLRQRLDDDINGLVDEAGARAQGDDFETLISLGFLPLGQY